MNIYGRHAEKTPNNTVRNIQYSIWRNNAISGLQIRIWTHKWHPTPRPHGRAMECLSWVLWGENRRVFHDDFNKWKHFPRYWPFVRGIHRWPVDSPHKGLWRGALIFYLIFAWTNNTEDGDMTRHRAHYNVTVMQEICLLQEEILKLFLKTIQNIDD